MFGPLNIINVVFSCFYTLNFLNENSVHLYGIGKSGSVTGSGWGNEQGDVAESGGSSAIVE